MAKITIQKRTDTNPFNEISQILNISDVEVNYPKRNTEPWRRFDPLKLLPSMTESARRGFVTQKITVSSFPEELMTLLTSEQWKQTDESFLKKAEANLLLFNKDRKPDFFEDHLLKNVPAKGLHILRISGSKSEKSTTGENTEVSEATPTIEIKPENSEMFSRHILFIYCEEDSRATLNIIKNSSAFDLSSIFIFQGKNSILRLRYLDENLESTSHGVTYLKSHQDKNSLCEIGVYNTSIKQNKKIFVENNLMENANARYSGIFTGKFCHVDHDFFINHGESYSKSDIQFKIAVLEEAYGIFWGDTQIVPGTRGCEGYQLNRNIILGENARVDAIPRLRIQTENVIASHGSATGEISDDEIFYMMSRGLSYNEARKLLLRGFFEDILRQSFGIDPDIHDTFLARIWSNIQQVIGTDIST